jgi:hypothetical protein
LAIVASVELPIGHWEDFLTVMASNSTNEERQYRLAAVQTLGQTMEFVEMYEKKLNNTQIGQILHSTVLNINGDDLELTEIAIQALSRAIPSTHENFANDE